MKNKKSSDSRRKLLKSIAAGSGAVVAGKSLPDSWSRPVVDSVLLPAHAATSGIAFGGSGLTGADASDSILNNLVPSAHAINGGVDNGCAFLLQNGDIEIFTQFRSNANVRKGVFTPGVEGVLKAIEVFPSCNGNDLPAVVQGYNENTGFFLDMDRLRGGLFFPRVGSCDRSTWPELNGDTCD